MASSDPQLSTLTMEKEVARHLNNLRAINLSDIGPEDELRCLIEDYFCDRGGETDSDGLSSSCDEEDSPNPPRSRSTPSPPVPVLPATDEPSQVEEMDRSALQPVGPSTSRSSTFDSDEEQFSPILNLGEGLFPSVASDAFTEGASLERLCVCKMYDGSNCFKRFQMHDLESHRLQCLEMTREELDITILAKISCGIHLSSHTTRSRKPQTERKAHRTNFYFHDYKVCRDVFKYMHGIGQDKLNSLLAHYKAVGIEARTHRGKNRRPKHALKIDETKAVIDFIINYAEVHAITLPGRTPHHWRSDVRLLPTNCTKKTVFDAYVISCTASQIRAVAYRTFRRLWQEILPFIATMRPATDLCWICQQGVNRITRASNKQDTEKIAANAALSLHLETVTKERSVYTTVCQETKRNLPPEATLGFHPACSCDTMIHYSFDFAQQIHFPSNPLQPGPIYFKTPRKCGLFGVCCEALSSQVNFLLDEACSTGKGANCVVSLLHYFFNHYSLGEKDLHLHADNCSGQNKNSCMMMYLMWRVLTGRHENITLSFLITGHTKFSPDWCFGLVKRLYRRTKVDCLNDIASVVTQSSKGNIPQLCGNEKGEVFVPMFDWTKFLGHFFRKVKQIKKYHHFYFTAGSGILKLREFSDSDFEEQSLLLSMPHKDAMPSVITPSGLDAKRQWYLYNDIRPFVDDRYQDLVAPLPASSRSTLGAEQSSESEEEATQAPPPPKAPRRGVKKGKQRGGLRS